MIEARARQRSFPDSTSGMREALEEIRVRCDAYVDEKDALSWLRSIHEIADAALSAVPAPLSDLENCVSLPVANEAPHLQQLSWQPIETAPKDGAYILAWGPDTYGVQKLAWRSAEDLLDMDRFTWRTDNDGPGYFSEYIPTHWMPLSPPPSELSGTITSGEPVVHKGAVVPPPILQWRPDPKTVEALRAILRYPGLKEYVGSVLYDRATDAVLGQDAAWEPDQRTVEAATEAVSRCAALDENGYVCEKSVAMTAIRSLNSQTSER